MKSQIKSIIHRMVRWNFIAMFICLAGAQGNYAAEPSVAPAERDAQLRNYVEWLRADLKTGKVEIFSKVMELSDAEAKIFWPIYQEYETELFALGDRRIELIKTFAGVYNTQTLDDAAAKRLTKDWFKLQDDRIALWKKYQKRIEKKLGAVRAGQFLQIENRIAALLDLMIASELPLISAREKK